MAGKRAKNLFNSVADFEHLRLSAYKARKRVRKTEELCAFFFELESHLLQLQQDLLHETYEPEPFRIFAIEKPKPRLIQASVFRDRVVHHALCSVIAPHLERSYLANSFACQLGKGGHRAVQATKNLSQRFAWYGKIDIHHFFETLHHPTLMRLLKRRLADKKILSLINRIIHHGRSPQSTNRGVPIGNLTSQHFANFYLDRLDHHLVEQLSIKAMIRYMDDVLFFAHDKRTIIDALVNIADFVQEHLQLRLKDSATVVAPSSIGIPFLGFRIYPTHIRFDQRRKKRFILAYKRILAQSSSEKEMTDSLNSLFAWAMQANTLSLRRDLIYGA